MNSSADAHTQQQAEASTGGAPEVLGYTLWTVLRRDPTRPFSATPNDAAELESAVERLAADGVTVRGFYDVSAVKADSDIMIWLHGSVPEDIQAGYRELLRTNLLKSLLPTWNALGMHREAEFAKDHSPAFMRGKAPEQWLTVYPFVRSYEWYLLPDAERNRMLRDHGMKGAVHRSVLTNTVASFSLGDYEWILALEAPELVQLVDLMRDLRYTEARLHVREEVPFYTGRRIEAADIAEVLL
jgi:chlorite dismutase